MTFRFVLPCLLFAAVPPAPAAPRPASAAGHAAVRAGADASTLAAKDSANFQSTQARIDLLFKGRDAPPVLPANIVDPFSSPAKRRAGRGDSVAASGPARAPSDRDLLEQIAQSIPVRGIVQAGGRRAVVIAKRPYSVGDRVTVQYGEETMAIVVRQITDETYTLGLGKAQLTLRLPR